MSSCGNKRVVRGAFGCIVMLCGATLCGCTMLTRFAGDIAGIEHGKTFYVGGAGSVGLVVGTESVPRGLRDAGYRGAIEVFGWQSWVGGTLRDQMDSRRNRQEARRLARRIVAYGEQYPGRPVNIIALSAGTGIVSWALADLPPDHNVRNVVFIGSSLSREYDISAALTHVDAYLWNFYSPNDPILRYALPFTGSVDREAVWGDVAGLYGFALPDGVADDVNLLYKDRLRNLPWRQAYARAGYNGRHTDGVKAEFVSVYMYPLLTTKRHAPETPRTTPKTASGRPKGHAPDELRAARETD